MADDGSSFFLTASHTRFLVRKSKRGTQFCSVLKTQTLHKEGTRRTSKLDRCANGLAARVSACFKAFNSRRWIRLRLRQGFRSSTAKRNRKHSWRCGDVSSACRLSHCELGHVNPLRL